MSKKVFSTLLLLTALAAGLVLLLPDGAEQPVIATHSPLLPELAGKASQLTMIRVSTGGDQVVATLQRSDGQWLVLEEQSYPADTDQLSSLLKNLSTAKIVEQKTTNPELYSRLGVEDVASEDAAGVQVAFDEASGLPAVIVGNAATGREGRYVRLANSDTSLLVDQRLDVSSDRGQWLQRDIVDISRDEVVEINVTHPDGEVIKATRVSADDENFELQDIPDGREPGSNWSVNSMAGGLSSLRLESVREDSSMDWTEAAEFSVLTADGMRANSWLVQEEDDHWIRLGVSVYQAMGDEILDKDETARELAQALTDRVNQINERVSGWAYKIPQSTYDTMTKRMEDLLKPLDSTGT